MALSVSPFVCVELLDFHSLATHERDPQCLGAHGHDCGGADHRAGFVGRSNDAAKVSRERNAQVAKLLRTLRPSTPPNIVEPIDIADRFIFDTLTARRRFGRDGGSVCGCFQALCYPVVTLSGLLSPSDCRARTSDSPKGSALSSDYLMRKWEISNSKDHSSVIGVELRLGFTEEPNVERYLESMARHKETDLPTHPRKWIVHVSHEKLLPAMRMSPLKRLRFYLFLFLRLVSRLSYYAYGLGDKVLLFAETCPSGCDNKWVGQC